MYSFHNANPLGLFVNDCVPRAISVATGKSWDYTYNMLSDLAQLKGTMLDDREFVIEYLDSKYQRVPTLPQTVGEVAKMYETNVLLITMNGHITCARYGTIIDSFDCRKRIVENAWIIE